jgi:hypothetical protein
MPAKASLAAISPAGSTADPIGEYSAAKSRSSADSASFTIARIVRSG